MLYVFLRSHDLDLVCFVMFAFNYCLRVMLIMYLALSVVVYKWELSDQTTRHVNKFKYHIPKYYIPIKSEVR
jgi:hypothetical protein